MDSLKLKPLANHLLIAIPERYEAPKGPRSPEGLGITLMAGEDSMKELEAAIRSGSVMRIETESDRSIKNLVRVGQVLQVPSRLDETMVLCAGGPKGHRTFADITPTVEVGDTVFLDVSALIPDSDGSNPNEILPGIYRLPYSAVICVIVQHFTDNAHPADLFPVGGFVLLSRVWADDVTDETDAEGGLVKCRKNAEGLIVETNVPPLPNEGVVAWVDVPLKGSRNEIHPGQRVLLAKGQAITETIAGTSYLVVRQDYVLAVKEAPTNPYALLSGCFTDEDVKAFDLAPEELGRWPKDKFVHYEHGLLSRHHLPLSHPAYNA